ncbi:MAG: ATP phosphoribosyltransferase regulatory subunit [Clostridia bacterium]|nr:ATP phosphoribosyltransferase regulatory subunit [Clostridia bacterium]
MIDPSALRFEEKIVFSLRSLYRTYGYLPYKMSKFEEYDLYLRHKDFLVSDRVIAFTDTSGKLMALKPDVTLSIIKNGEDVPGVKQKVCYNENVYRVSESTHRFKEIMQAGLECIGDIDLCDIYEVISLAARTLSLVCENFCIGIGNMDLLSAILSAACDAPEFISEAFGYIEKKDAHDLAALCDRYGVDASGKEKVLSLLSLCGARARVLAGLSNVCGGEIDKLRALSALLEKSPYSDKIQFDFSVASDRNYYNGFVFKGFVDGVYCSVLEGGQYENLMKKMDRTSGAVGFALYLDRLEDLCREERAFDVDCLLLYDGATDPLDVVAATERLIGEGKTVSAQKSVPEKLRYKETVDLRKG